MRMPSAGIRGLSAGQRPGVAIDRAAKRVLPGAPADAPGVSETMRIEPAPQALTARHRAIPIGPDRVLRPSDRLGLLGEGPRIGTRGTVKADSKECVPMITGVAA